MLKVEFTQEVNGVMDVVCDHISTDTHLVRYESPRRIMHEVSTILLHFNRTTTWDVNPEKIKHISSWEQSSLLQY